MPVRKYLVFLPFILMFVFAVGFASAQTNGCVLTVKTTASNGTVWGNVTAKYGGKTVDLSNASQKLNVPCGTTVTLTETPTNPSNRSFKTWSAPGSYLNHPSSSTIRLPVYGSMTVAARYKAASSSSSSGSSGSWG